MENQKNSRWKFFGALLAAVFLAFGGLVALRAYDAWRGERSVREFAEGMERAEEELYKMQLADTVGGKTPQETLRLYIAAVEAGDYELASKYFVIEKQEEELKILRNAPRDNTDNVISLLREDLKSEGSFSESKDGYTIRKPILVDFTLYPSGNWKILDI